MARAEQKIGQVKEAINEWKAKGEVSKLNSALTGPRQYAADAVFIAMRRGRGRRGNHRRPDRSD